MARGWKQIDADAHAAVNAVRSAGRPLRISEIADALRREGRQQTEKQARTTAERAVALGLMYRRGLLLWDVVPVARKSSWDVTTLTDTTPTELFIRSARQLLELAPSATNNRTVRGLLDEVLKRISIEGDTPPAGTSPRAPRDNGNGVRHDVDPTIEVLFPPDR